MSNVQKSEQTTSDIPFGVKLALILVSFAISLFAFRAGFTKEAIYNFAVELARNFMLIPGIFVGFGWLLKFADKDFKLSNAYYLGLFMSIVLSYQMLKSA